MPIIDDSALDAGLGVVDNATRLVICSAEPANYAGIAAVTLGTVTVDSGDFSIADAGGGGRALTLAAQSFTASASGTASHWALDDGATLLAANALASTLAVTNGQAYNVASAVVARFPDATSA